MPFFLGKTEAMPTLVAFGQRHYTSMRVWGWIGRLWAVGVVRVEPHE